MQVMPVHVTVLDVSVTVVPAAAVEAEGGILKKMCKLV